MPQQEHDLLPSISVSQGAFSLTSAGVSQGTVGLASAGVPRVSPSQSPPKHRAFGRTRNSVWVNQTQSVWGNQIQSVPAPGGGGTLQVQLQKLCSSRSRNEPVGTNSSWFPQAHSRAPLPKHSVFDSHKDPSGCEQAPCSVGTVTPSPQYHPSQRLAVFIPPAGTNHAPMLSNRGLILLMVSCSWSVPAG